jgi:hypothetical protein
VGRQEEAAFLDALLGPLGSRFYCSCIGESLFDTALCFLSDFLVSHPPFQGCHATILRRSVWTLFHIRQAEICRPPLDRLRPPVPWIGLDLPGSAWTADKQS